MILLLILDCGVFSDVFITHHLWFNFWQVICSFLKIKCTVYCEMGWLSLLRVTKPSSKLVLHMQVYLQPSVAWSGLGGLSGLEVGLGRPRAASRSASRSASRPISMTSAASRSASKWPRWPRQAIWGSFRRKLQADVKSGYIGCLSCPWLDLFVFV